MDDARSSKNSEAALFLTGEQRFRKIKFGKCALTPRNLCVERYRVAAK